MPEFTQQLLIGSLLTIALAVCSSILALIFAVFLSLIARSRSLAMRKIANFYSDFVRGIPELLFIFLIYYGSATLLTKVYGEYSELGPFWSGVIALGIVFGAYASEILGAAIDDIPKGQYEASIALGMTKIKSFTLIILPQLVRRAIPGMGNLWLILLKETSLVSVIGLEELMRKTNIAAGVSHNPMLYYSVGALLYLAITSFSEFSFSKLDKRASKYVY